ncbi:hypothetical protein YC2023_108738 [Brassica napus]
MMKDEEAISKAASSVEVIGEWLKHPHVAQATREGSHDHEPGQMHGKIKRSLRRANHKQGASLPWFELK